MQAPWDLETECPRHRAPIDIEMARDAQDPSPAWLRGFRGENRFELVGGNKKPALSAGGVHLPEFGLGFFSGAFVSK